LSLIEDIFVLGEYPGHFVRKSEVTCDLFKIYVVFRIYLIKCSDLLIYNNDQVLDATRYAPIFGQFFKNYDGKHVRSQTGWWVSILGLRGVIEFFSKTLANLRNLSKKYLTPKAHWRFATQIKH